MLDPRRSIVDGVDIQVEFRGTDVGWLWFDVRLGRTTLAFSATAIVDPMPKLLGSLEAVVDRQRTWFPIWEEGWTSGFVLEPNLSDQKLIDVTVYRGSDENAFGARTERELVAISDVYFKGTLSARAFVKAFYDEIRRFAQSDAYDPMEWSGELLRDQLRQELPDPISEEELLDDELMKDALETYFHFEAVDYRDRLLERCFDEIQQGRRDMSFEDIFNEFKMKLLRPQPSGPWDNATRVALMKELLEGAIGRWLAADLRVLVSPKIQGWLARHGERS